MVKMVGMVFEKPFEACIKLVPMSSNTIAKDKKRYFMDDDFTSAKKR